MDINLNFQDLFDGFQSTSLLWNTNLVSGLNQLSISNTVNTFVPKNKDKRLRLGKWVEEFVAFQLQQDPEIRILNENILVKRGKQTIGELDLLLLKDEQPIHLEIIYKFYLYDSINKYEDKLNYWIGPNRNDNLIFKIDKLKKRQLPLLYQEETKDALKHYNINVDSIKQYVCFKAQLFLPFDLVHNYQDDIINPLNTNCVVGWYLNYKNIQQLKLSLFYIPDKLQWLNIPKESVKWITFNEAKNAIFKQISNKRSPLCWIKNENNKLQKCFITWW